ncbi:hypothetical protein [Halorubrum laminariae]|uniref:DUF1102 domain-containing protein n=1 Tax=Halorubrum laminariae TaxID=1433523 RepID=A0ABD6C128_9EURY|nr:hypothetical protein [Halorubrum laminariae]
MVIGLGALATGSGAAFTSAGFQDSVDSGADMRVVADQQLTVRKGDIFEGLDAGEVNEPTERGSDDIFTAVVSEDDGPTPTEILFGDTEINGYTNVSTDTESNRIPTPAAVANDGEDGNFAFAIAVEINDDVEFGDLIEVENQNIQDGANIGITFQEFGDDASEVTGETGGEEAVATQIYQFKDEDDTQISPDSESWSSSNEQDPATRVEIGVGETEQISLLNDTGGGDTGISARNIRSAISGDNEPAFGTNINDIDLVDTIEIGEGSN